MAVQMRLILLIFVRLSELAYNLRDDHGMPLAPASNGTRSLPWSIGLHDEHLVLTLHSPKLFESLQLICQCGNLVQIDLELVLYHSFRKVVYREAAKMSRLLHDATVHPPSDRASWLSLR